MSMPQFLSFRSSLAHGAKSALVALTLVIGLAACSQEAGESVPPASAVEQDKAFDLVASQGHGFNAGAVMSATKVYVFFDPQCPHCAHLWQSTQALKDKVHFIWMPVAFINGNSLPQGAALLRAADPVAAMTEHEALLLARKGGMSTTDEVPEDLSSQIKSNTALLSQLGAESVPYIVARNAKTQAPVQKAGALEPAALATLLGLD